MADTVASLKASFTLDTKDSRKQAKDLGVNVRQLRSTLRGLLTEEEKQRIKLNNVSKAIEGGVGDVDNLRIAQARLEKQLEKTNADLTTQGKTVSRASGKWGDFSSQQGMSLLGRGRFGGAATSLAGMGAAGAATGGALLGAGAAVGGVAATGKFTARQAEMTVALADSADRIGVVTSELRGLQHAGQLTGVSTATMTMALQRMRRRASEAAQGTGEAQNALKELGIDAKEFSEMGAADQMGTLSDAFRDVSSGSDRLRLAFKLFDSEGVAVLNTLGMGSEKLQQYRERFEAAYSDEAIENARAVSAGLTELNVQFELMSKTVANELTPAMAGLLEVVNGMLSGEGLKSGGLGDAVQRSLLDTLTGGMYSRFNPRGDTEMLGPATEAELAAARQGSPLEETFDASADEERRRKERLAADPRGDLLRANMEFEKKMAKVAAKERSDLFKSGVRDEIDERKKAHSELQESLRDEIQKRKAWNRSLEQAVTQGPTGGRSRAQLERERNARSAASGFRKDVESVEERLAKSTADLNETIKKLNERLSKGTSPTEKPPENVVDRPEMNIAASVAGSIASGALFRAF